MSLETRVETLEHELKILKNEIENTLLEIQNQVLIHYYPSLRAENGIPPKDLSRLLASSPTEPKDQPQGKENGRQPSLDDDGYPAPRTKEVSLSEIGGKSKPPALPRSAQAPLSTGEIMRGPQAAVDQIAFAHIAKWVNDATAKIGKARTQEMVMSHANAEYCTPEIKDLLLQFVSLSEEENPPEQVETKELMDILLKLNKVLHQVGSATAAPASVKESSVG